VYGIYIRVYLFGLFLRRINHTNPSTEPIQLVLSHLYISSLDALFMFGCVCSRHGFVYMHFDSDLLIHVCLFMHATWQSSHTCWVASDNPELVCPDFRA